MVDGSKEVVHGIRVGEERNAAGPSISQYAKPTNDIGLSTALPVRSTVEATDSPSGDVIGNDATTTLATPDQNLNARTLIKLEPELGTESPPRHRHNLPSVIQAEENNSTDDPVSQALEPSPQLGIEQVSPAQQPAKLIDAAATAQRNTAKDTSDQDAGHSYAKSQHESTSQQPIKPSPLVTVTTSATIVAERESDESFDEDAKEWRQLYGDDDPPELDRARSTVSPTDVDTPKFYTARAQPMSIPGLQYLLHVKQEPVSG